MSAALPTTPGSAAPLFAALGDETRLGLVARLSSEAAVSISGLTAGTGVTRQAVTKHLQVLEEVGLVRGSRRGRESLWQLEPRPLDVARAYLELISTRWDERIGRLVAHLEADHR
ncbi:MAG: ArsR/SmtB family transcription factor [Tepidiformaceae bacterium]